MSKTDIKREIGKVVSDLREVEIYEGSDRPMDTADNKKLLAKSMTRLRRVKKMIDKSR